MFRKYSPKTLVVLDGVIPLETFPLVEWHYGELADVASFTVLKTQICVTRPQCVKHCCHQIVAVGTILITFSTCCLC
jgi:hypothetical protein